jgi:hypothetical protein
MCGIDVAREAPQLVVNYVDQPPFLGLVLHEAEASTANASVLKPLLAEAALRSSAVAGELLRLPPSVAQTPFVATNCSWSNSKLVEDSRLGEYPAMGRCC